MLGRTSGGLGFEGGKSRRKDRRHERFPLQAGEILLRLSQPGGDIVERTVRGINISAGGMAFSHKAFTHPGALCEVVMLDLLGRRNVLGGKIAWCALGEKRMHNIGMAFEEMIDPRRFVDPGIVAESLDEAETEPEEIHGSVLLIDEQELDRELATMYLDEVGLKVSGASTVEEALAVYEDHPLDLVVTDLSVNGVEARALLDRLREAGFDGDVILVTSESTRNRDSAVAALAPRAVVDKPYRPTDLLEAVQDSLRQVQIPMSDEPIYSNLESLLSLAEPVKRFIAIANKKSEEMAAAIESDSIEDLRKTMQTLVSNGEGFGFPIVSKAATAALRRLDATMSAKESRDSVRRLQAVIKRLKLRPGKAGTSAA